MEPTTIQQHSSIFQRSSESNERIYDKSLIFSINFFLFNSFHSRQNHFSRKFCQKRSVRNEERKRKIHITNLQIMSHTISYAWFLCVFTFAADATTLLLVVFIFVCCVCCAILESITISLFCLFALFLHSVGVKNIKSHNDWWIAWIYKYWMIWLWWPIAHMQDMKIKIKKKPKPPNSKRFVNEVGPLALTHARICYLRKFGYFANKIVRF